MDIDAISTSSLSSLDLDVSDEFVEGTRPFLFEADVEDFYLHSLKPDEKSQLGDSTSEPSLSTSADLGTLLPSSSKTHTSNIPSKIVSGKRSLREVYSETIKEEIRCKIQLRRISLGQEELKVDFAQPEPTICYDAVRSRNEIREKNKIYAKQSRDRARAGRHKLIESNRELTSTRLKLRDEIKRLRRTLNICEEFLNQHRTVCQYS
ncbi:activating transcription factor 3 [Biomphalaria pfeifferi]|uniref:Activating transcription factor 3 n=1 Tax=Biomphalaria pfeifferi TaxID=112525 RepID=A0AAD8BSC7_BIOPF|nr:activating transcription factor 3 [Biomphalaria pfeifferi]